MPIIRKTAAVLLAAALILPPGAGNAAEYQYFRMIGGGSRVIDPGPVTPPAPGTLNYVLHAAAQSTVGKTYSGIGEVVGASGAVAFSVESGSLPPGVSLNPSTGGVAGVTTTAGSFTAVLMAQDAAGAVGTATLTVVVSGPLSVSAAPADIATVGIPYATPFAGVGGQPPYSFFSSYSFPPGLTLGADGMLSGTPVQAGGYSNLFVQVRDAAGRLASSPQFSIRVANPLAVTWSPASGTAGVPYSPALPVASGGQSPFMFSVVGVLPDGLTLNSATGALSGTPQAEGTYHVGLTAIDVDGRSAQTGLKTLTIADGSPVLPPGSPLALTALPSAKAQVGVGYSSRVRAGGGTAPYSVTSTGGTLPSGLMLSADGTLSGTPDTAGTWSGLVFKATDAASDSVSSSAMTITVAPKPALLISGTPNGSAQVGSPYTATFTGFEGSGHGYTFSVAAGTLPPGLILSDAMGTSGVISGTPASVGTYAGIRIRVTDSDGQTADSQPFSIAVSALPGPSLTVTGNPPSVATVGKPYSGAYSASGGSGSGYVFSLASGALPSWLALDSATGALSGTPTAPGTASFTVKAVDGQGVSGNAPATTVTVYGAFAFATASLPAASAGKAYSTTLAVSGGHAPTTFSITSGALPNGLSLNSSSGTISGVPTVGGGVAYPVTFAAVDADGRTASLATSLTVNDSMVMTFTAPVGAVGQPYSATPAVDGGAAPYVFAATDSSDAAIDFAAYGLNFDTATGVISGVPTQSGTTPSFTLSATDALGQTASVSGLSIHIASAVSISGNPPTSVAAGNPYSTTFTASGGVGAKTFSLASGALPGWLTLNAATGTLSGTPSAADAGTVGPFAIQATDGAGFSAVSIEFSIQVIAGDASATPDQEAYRSGTAVGASLATSLPAPTWTFVQSPASPSLGLSASGGRMTGTMPALASQQTFTITATATSGAASAAAEPFVLTGNPSMTISGGPSVSSVLIIGSTYSLPAPVVAHALATPAFSLLKSGSPYAALAADCPGLAFSIADGTISGQPTAACSQSALRIRATDPSDGTTATTAQFSLSAVVGTTSVGAPTPSPVHSGQPFSGTLTTTLDNPEWTFRVPTVASPDIVASGNTSTATYSGTAPSVASAMSLTLYAKATSGPASIESAGVALQVRPPLAIANLTDGVYNAGGSFNLGPASISNAIGTVSYSLLKDGAPVNIGSLCPGAAFSAGKISGTYAGSCYVTGLQIQAHDSADTVDTIVTTAPFRLSVAPAVNIAAPAAANQGKSYSHQLVGTGGRPPYTYSVATGSLPAGIALDGATGILSSDFVTGSTSTVGIRIMDADGRYTQPSYTFTVQPASASMTLTDSTVRQGAAFSGTLTTSLDDPVWSIAQSPTTPALGMTNDGTTFSGTAPSVSTSTAFSLTATASQSGLNRNTAATTLTVKPEFSMGGGPSGTVYGNVGTSLLTASLNYGGTNIAAAPTVVLLQDGAPATIGTLCPGLSLNATSGSVSGTPSAVCDVSGLTLRATDSDGSTASTAIFGIAVGATQTAPTGSLAGSGIMGTAYSSGPLTVNGGVAPYTWSVASGTLPNGLSLNPSTGVVSGTISWASNYSFTLRVTDAAGKVSPNSATQTIAVTRTPGLSGTLAATGQVGTFYSSGPLAVGTGGPGTPPYTYALNGTPTLPPGLTLDAQTGVVSGIPTTAVTYTSMGNNTPALVLVDANGVTSGYVVYNPMTISAATASATMDTASVRQGATVSGTLTTSLTDPAWTFAAAPSPSGQPALTLAASGTTFSGAAPSVTASTVYSVVATATNSATSKAASAISVTVKPDPQISGGPMGVVGNIGTPIATTDAPSVANAMGAISYSLRKSGLPYSAFGTDCPGLALDPSTGRISGTPTGACDISDLAIRATDAYDGHYDDTDPFPVSVTEVLAIDGAYPDASGFSPYSESLPIRNGSAPYTADVQSGSLPPGLSLSIVGDAVVLSGTPTGGTMTYPFTLRVTDGAAQVATSAQSVKITAPPPVIDTELSGGFVGEPYSVALSVSGGIAPFTWGVISGLPTNGLTLDGSGVLSGTPTTVNPTISFTIKVVDAEGTIGQKSFTISVGAGLAISGTAPSGYVGTAYSFVPTVSGGSGSNVFSVSDASGTLAGIGLTLDPSTGKISGSNPIEGSWSGVLSVTNGAGVVKSLNATISISSTNTVYGFGVNPSGGLGNGTTTNTSVPVAVVGGISFSQVWASNQRSCGISTSGGLYCWGANEIGQLGDGSTTTRLSPVPVVGMSSGVTNVGMGLSHTCAVRNGALYCWGKNDRNQFGDGTTTDRQTPYAISSMSSGVTEVSAGLYHTCALKGGSLYCWGGNPSGQVGDGTTTDRQTPYAISSMASGVTQVRAGHQFTCAIKSNALYCWGLNSSYQIGDGSQTNRTSPVSINGMTSGVTQISLGGIFGCAIQNSALKCWGWNVNGQLGNGTTTQSPTPAAVSGLSSGVTYVGSGYNHACALKSGSLYCWGYNNGGQLGDGTTTQNPTPAPVPGFSSGVTQISGGNNSTLVVKSQ